jgi:sugar transferase (PEP-CTERM/EpsH1 system associated)
MSRLSEDYSVTLPEPNRGSTPLPEIQRRPSSSILRVLHVLDHLDTGGTEYGVLKVLQGLPEDRFDCQICVMRDARADLASSALLSGRVLRAGGPKEGSQFGIRRLFRVFRTWRPHIVHSRNWGAIEAIPAARLARVPIAIHSEHGYELDMLKGLPLRRRMIRRGFYQMADAVFAVTHDLSSYHAKQVHWREGKIGTIYNGVDAARFSPRPSERIRLRKELGLPENRFVIGAAGRLVPIKSYPTLLKAAENLVRSGHDISILMIGAGPERSFLEQMAAPLGDRVLFLGERHDLPALFNAMDGFAQTSICEGMSNTILEAMASALPVLASRVGGNPELVADERTGFLFPVQDASALADRISLLARNVELRRALGVEARHRVLAEFTLDRMIDAYAELYATLSARRGLTLPGEN